MQKGIYEKTFSLGAGTLYVLPGRVTSAALRRSGVRAGDTEDGCSLRYDYRQKQLYDADGNVAATIKYGGKAYVTGKIVRISPDAMETLMFGDRRTGGEVSMLLVYRLPDDEEFSLYARGVVGSSRLTMRDGTGGLEFEFVCGEDFVQPKLSLRTAEAV